MRRHFPQFLASLVLTALMSVPAAEPAAAAASPLDLGTKSLGDAPAASVTLYGGEIAVDGQLSGTVRLVTSDALTGDVVVTFAVGESVYLLDRLVEELSGSEVAPADLVLTGYDELGAPGQLELVGATFKEVSFSTLDAKDGKSFLKATVSFTPTEVKYSNGSGALLFGGSPSQLSSWDVHVPGIATDDIEGFGLTARRPTEVHAAWEVAGLEVTGSAAQGEAAAQWLVDTGEDVDFTLAITDDATGESLDIVVATKGVEVHKGGTPQWTLEMLCETQRVHIQHK